VEVSELNEDGYAQIWKSRDEDFEEKFDSLGNQAYLMDSPGYDEGMLFETDAGPAFIGRKDGDIVFTGSRAAVNRAYDEFAQDLGAYQDAFNGVEEHYELEPEIKEMLDHAEDALRREEMMNQVLEGTWTPETPGPAASSGESYAATDD
jgi:hypothetical protein